MSGQNLSKDQLEFLKQFIKSEEGKSAKEANVENTASFEAFGRAIFEQIKQGSMEEAEKGGSSTGEIVLETQMVISPASSGGQENMLSEEQEGWLGDIYDKVKDHFGGKDATKVCVSFFGKKICYDVNPFN